MDELRIEIWDLLYRAQKPKLIREIAESMRQDSATIRTAVNHEWFTLTDEMVTIS